MPRVDIVAQARYYFFATATMPATIYAIRAEACYYDFYATTTLLLFRHFRRRHLRRH